MTSLKKYLLEYNNKDASELGEPRLRDVVQLVFMFVFPIYTFSIRSPRFEFVCFFNFLFFFASLWTVFGGLTVMVQHFVKRCGSISDNFKVYNVRFTVV